MVVDLEAVQLHDQHAIVLKSFVFRTTMRALAAEESLIPSAAGFDVGHCDKWLWSHRFLRICQETNLFSIRSYCNINHNFSISCIGYTAYFSIRRG